MLPKQKKTALNRGFFVCGVFFDGLYWFAALNQIAAPWVDGAVGHRRPDFGCWQARQGHIFTSKQNAS